jgi:hypothetical protein
VAPHHAHAPLCLRPLLLLLLLLLLLVVVAVVLVAAASMAPLTRPR